MSDFIKEKCWFLTIYFAELTSANRIPSSSVSDSPSLANLQNKHNRDQQYLAVHIQNGSRNSNSVGSDSYKTEGNGKIFTFLTKNFSNLIFEQNTLKTSALTRHSNSINKHTAKVLTVETSIVVLITPCEGPLCTTMSKIIIM